MWFNISFRNERTIYMEKMSDNICSPVVARAPWIVDGRTHPVKLLAAAISGSCTSPTQPVPGPIGYQKNTNANTKNILDTNIVMFWVLLYQLGSQYPLKANTNSPEMARHISNRLL